MDLLGRLWGARWKLSLAGLAPFLRGDRLWIAAGLAVAAVLLGISLILAVCWLVNRMKDDEDVDIETPIITVRRGKSKKLSEKDSEKAEEKVEKDGAKTS